MKTIEEFVFLDIETLPAHGLTEEELKQAALKKVPANYKLQDTINKWVEENYLEIHKKTALDSNSGRVLLVCACNSQGKWLSFFFDQDNYEEAFLKFEERFLDYLGKRHVLLVGHNIKNFDLLYLRRHSLMCGADRLAGRLASAPSFDTMLEWNFGTGRDEKWVGLNRLAQLLKIDSQKTGGMNGSQIYEYYQNGRLNDILEYCQNDVYLVHRIFAALKPILDNFYERNRLIDGDFLGI